MDISKWCEADKVEILRLQLQYARLLCDQKERDYLAIIERLKAVAVACSTSAPGSLTHHRDQPLNNLNTLSLVSGAESLSEPIELMHTVLTAAIAKDRMTLGIGMLSGSLASSATHVHFDDDNGNDNDDNDNDNGGRVSERLRDAMRKVGKLEEAVAEATKVLAPILDALNGKLQGDSFRAILSQSDDAWGDMFARYDDTDSSGDDISDVTPDVVESGLLSEEIRRLREKYRKRKKRSYAEKIRDLLQEQHQGNYLARDRLLEKLEKRAKISKKRIEQEREFVPGSFTGGQLKPGEARRASSAGPTRQKMKPIHPLKQGPTGNKSFVDNNVHEGWRQFETMHRREKAKSVLDNNVAPAQSSSLSPSVRGLQQQKAVMEEKSLESVNDIGEEEIHVSVEKLLHICSELQNRSQSLHSLQELIAKAVDAGISKDRKEADSSPHPRTGHIRWGSTPQHLPLPVSSSTLQDRKIYRDTLHDEYKKCVNEANRLKGIMNSIDNSMGNLVEEKGGNENPLVRAQQQKVVSHYSSKLLIPTRLVTTTSTPFSRSMENLSQTEKRKITSTSANEYTSPTLPSLAEGKNGR